MTRNQGDSISYQTIERDLRQQGRSLGLREAVTSSQVALTISLTTMNMVVNNYANWPALYEQLAEKHTSNSIDEVWPEEWSADIPVPVAETVPAKTGRTMTLPFRRTRTEDKETETVG